MITTIAIDGACRGNGKPDCLSTGAFFVKDDSGYFLKAVHEQPSTNQRGELNGLILALDFAISKGYDNIFFISDSEYIVNCINKEWYKNWVIKGWITSLGEPVKNRDLWEVIADKLEQLNEYSFYHIKGHVMSVGKVTAQNLLNKDKTGKQLYDSLVIKYDTSRQDKKDYATQCFRERHGFDAPVDVFKEMIVCNTVADTVASLYADNMMEV